MFKRTLGIAVAVVIGAVLVSASSAAITRAPAAPTIDVSTRAMVNHYLRSIHVNPKNAVIERGSRNYAGARCPGKGWTCASTKHTVVQIAKAGGVNRFLCKSSKCAVVQISGVSHGVYYAGPQRAPRASLPNPQQTATCIKTTGLSQSCSITQTSSTKNNVAVVYENEPKSSGLTQSASATASITQQATGATNGNEACVTQNINVDGSTTAQKGKSVVVTLDAHQSVSIKQDVAGSGPNQAFEAATSGGGCTSQIVAPATTAGIAQTQVLTSSANGAAAITQNEDTSAMLCGGGTTTPLSADANMCLDIEQNQNNGSPHTSTATGPNTATFDQENQLVALGNTAAGGSVTQTQGNSDPSVVTGLAGKINQNSNGGKSTFTGTQNETQCEDAFKNTTPLPTPTNPLLCVNQRDKPSGITVTQQQYGPEGMGQPTAHHGPVGFLSHVGKDPSDSSQTGNPNSDSFTVNQSSTQTNDSNFTQNNHVIGGAKTDGSGTVNQNVTLQGAPKVDVQTGNNATVSGSIDCTSYTLGSCTKTLSAPTITGRSPAAPVFGTDSTTFTFSNPDPTVKFSCSLTGAVGSYSP